MNTKTPNNSERVWVKNQVVHCGDDEYPISELRRIVVQVSDLSFVKDTVRLYLDFGESALIIPSMHSSYDTLFEHLGKCVRIDDDAYLRAMNCDYTCDFVIFERKDKAK